MSSKALSKTIKKTRMTEVNARCDYCDDFLEAHCFNIPKILKQFCSRSCAEEWEAEEFFTRFIDKHEKTMKEKGVVLVIGYIGSKIVNEIEKIIDSVPKP